MCGPGHQRLEGSSILEGILGIETSTGSWISMSWIPHEGLTLEPYKVQYRVLQDPSRAISGYIGPSTRLYKAMEGPVKGDVTLYRAL